MTLNELKALQDERGLGGIHVVQINAEGFTIAHTDAERDTKAAGGASLWDCPLHKWLVEIGGPPGGSGVFVAHPDVPGCADPWYLEPLGGCLG